MKRNPLTDEHARYLMAHGELPDEVRTSSSLVAVVLTQTWCPQWGFMSSYLDSMADRTDLSIWEYLYDRSPLFAEFMDYKERILGNDQIPYVRYYVDGILVKTTNFVGAAQFLAILEGRR